MARTAKAAKATATGTDAGFGRLDPLAEIVLLWGGGLGAVAMSILQPVLPLLQHSFAAEPGANFLIPMIVSACAGAAILMSLLAGPLVHRFGRLPVALTAQAAFVIAGVSGMWLPSLALIVVSRAVTGGAGALFATICFTLIADLNVGQARERRLGLGHGIAAVSAGLLLPIGGALADIDWRLVFLVHLVGVPIFIMTCLSRSLRGADAWIRQRVEKQPPRLEKATYYSRVVLLLGAVALVSGAIIYTTQYYVPFRLREIGVYTAKLSSVIYFIAMLSSTLTALVYGEVRRRLSAISIMVVVFAGVVGAIVVLAAAPSVAAIMGAMTVLGLSYGLFSPNLVSLVASATDEVSRPHAVGLVKGLHNGGPLVGPLLLQFVYLAYQAEGALYTLAGMAGVMLAGATGIFAVRRLQAVRAAA